MADPQIEALNLADTARAAAYTLKRAHPEVTFTSGRRDRRAQARAMAGNVALNRQWIVQTYLDSEASRACQRWVDAHPEATTSAAIAEGLAAVLEALPDVQAGRISKHLSGEAFDVQPVTANAEQIKTTIRALPGMVKFLEKEGGLIRWHVQF